MTFFLFNGKTELKYEECVGFSVFGREGRGGAVGILKFVSRLCLYLHVYVLFNEAKDGMISG